MKHYFLALLMTGSIGLFAGCATQNSTAANDADPSRRTYTQKQLNNTGRQETARQVEAVDPAVSVSNGR